MPRPASKPPNIDASSRKLVWCFAALLMALGLVLVVQGSINTNELRTHIISIIKEKTGQEVFIHGSVSVQILPRPLAYVTGLDIRNPDDKTHNPEVTAEVAILYLNFFTLLSERPEIKRIAMQRPVLDITRGKDNEMYWGWLNGGLIKSMLEGQDENAAVGFEVVDGRVSYHNLESDETLTISAIYAIATNEDDWNFSGEATMFGHDFQFSFDTSPGEKEAPKGYTPLNAIVFLDDKNSIKLQGAIDLLAPKIEVKGDFSLVTDNLRRWMDPPKPASSGMVGIAEKEIAPQTLPPLPVKILGNWLQSGQNIELVDAEFQGLNSGGKGSVSLSWSENIPNLSIEMECRVFDYNEWESAFHDVFSQVVTSASTFGGYTPSTIPVNPLPDDMHIMLYLDIDQLFVGQQTWRSAKISAALADAAITVNQFNVLLPGETALSLFGVVSEGNASGLRFEGSMEMQGKSLREMLTMVDKSAEDLPQANFDQFSANSNIFISPAQLRLSEATFKISDFRLDGGMVAYFDAQPRVEADVKLQDINFDYFRDLWRLTHTDPKSNDYFLKLDRNTNWSILRKLAAQIDFKVAVDGFTLFDRTGKYASFRLSAKEGEMGLYNMRFDYGPQDTLDANLSLNVKDDLPSVSVQINANQLNTDYFLPAAAATKPQPQLPPDQILPQKREWSEELIDFSWMDGFSGVFDLNIGRFIHRGVALDNLKFRGRLESNALAFKNATFNYWGGKCTLSGQVFGGSVPGLSLAFTLYDLQLREIISSAAGYNTIGGRVSASGTVATSGVNPKSWLMQADSNLVFAARGVGVERLSLTGVVDAVRVSRTSADVLNNANLALVNGVTEFSVDGTLNMRNALIRTPGLTLRSGISNGLLTGEIKLLPWKMESSTIFKFPILSTESVPTLTVQLFGPIEDLQRRIDTSSLEAYVAKQIIGH